MPSDDFYEKHAPEFKRRLQPTEEQRKKHPRLLFLIQYRDNEPVMKFAPDETKEEKRKRWKERAQKSEVRKIIKTTKKEIKAGKQKKIISYFVK